MSSRRCLGRRLRAAAIALAISLVGLAPATAFAGSADNTPAAGAAASALSASSSVGDAADGYVGLTASAPSTSAPTVVREHTVVHDGSGGNALPITLAAVALAIAIGGTGYVLVRIAPQQRELHRGAH